MTKIGCNDKTIKLFNLSNENQCRALRGATGSVIRVRFSPSGAFIVGSCMDGTVRLWNSSNLRVKHVFIGHQKKVYAADFSPGEMKRIISGSHDRTIKIWNIERGTSEKTILQTCKSSVNDLECTSFGIISSGHFDASIRFHDIRSYKLCNEIKKAHSQQITSINYSRDERYILSNSRDNTLNIYDIRTYKLVETIENPNYVNSFNYNKAVFGPNRKYICAGSNNSIFIWNIDEKKVEKILKGHEETVSNIMWNEYQLASSSFDKSVIFWN